MIETNKRYHPPNPLKSKAPMRDPGHRLSTSKSLLHALQQTGKEAAWQRFYDVFWNLI